MPHYYDQLCHAMLAALPGFPYMLDDAAQTDESLALASCAEKSDSPGDWGICDINDGCNEFAAEWEHAGRP